MKHLLIISTVAILSGAAVYADYFAFTSITANAPQREIVADQLFIGVNTLDTNHSGVLFTNIGPEASSITEVYFGSNLELLSLNIDSELGSSIDVNFRIDGAHPSNPPGAQEFANWWMITVAAAESVPQSGGQAKNGISPLEYLELQLSYSSDSTLSELLQAGEVQVAMHVTALDGGYSDTFVNTQSATLIPEPASALLIGISGVLFAFVRRRFVF